MVDHGTKLYPIFINIQNLIYPYILIKFWTKVKLYWDVEVWISLDLITLILHCLVLWWNRINDYYPTFVFTMCPSVVGFAKCFCKCKCPNHISATSLGLCYGNHGLKGRLNHNKFNMVIIAIGFIRCGLWFWPPTLTSFIIWGNSSNYEACSLLKFVTTPLLWDRDDIYGTTKEPCQYLKAINTIEPWLFFFQNFQVGVLARILNIN